MERTHVLVHRQRRLEYLKKHHPEKIEKAKNALHYYIQGMAGYGAKYPVKPFASYATIRQVFGHNIIESFGLLLGEWKEQTEFCYDGCSIQWLEKYGEKAIR